MKGEMGSLFSHDKKQKTYYTTLTLNGKMIDLSFLDLSFLVRPVKKTSISSYRSTSSPFSLDTSFLVKASSFVVPSSCTMVLWNSSLKWFVILMLKDRIGPGVFAKVDDIIDKLG